MRVAYLGNDCKLCKKHFHVRPSLVKKGYGIFCSNKCFYEFTKQESLKKSNNPLRVCRVCLIEKEKKEFSPDYRMYSQIQSVCKSCKREIARKDRIKRPEIYKQRDIEKLYGLTYEEYKKLELNQNGVCAICKLRKLSKNGYLHVDHCHRTNRVRGLLCGNCNTAIGKFYESIHYLKSAIQYLESN